VSVGAIEFVNCTFDGSASDHFTLSIRHSASPVFNSCSILTAKRGSVYCYTGSAGTFSRSKILGDGSPDKIGVILDNASTVFDECVLSDFGTGVFVASGSEGAVISRSTFSNIHGIAIRVEGDGSARFKKNFITDADHYGVLVSGEKGTSVFIENVVHGRWRVKPGCHPTLIRNSCFDEIIPDTQRCALRGIAPPRGAL